MLRVFLLSNLIFLISFVNIYSQTTPDSLSTDTIVGSYPLTEIKGIVLDINKQEPLPYTNIYVLNNNRGAITNELGHFNIDASGLAESDTLRFQYIGYKTKNITLGELDDFSVIYLKEEIINLSETLIFGNTPDALSIVKKVIKNKDANYKTTNSKNQTFIRQRDNVDIDEFSLKLKRSSFQDLNEELAKLVEEVIPKHSTSYTDFLGDLYFSEDEDDTIRLKIDPIRTVSLKEKDIAELDQLEFIFKNLFEDTKEDEYWKVKSGIFSHKMDIEEENDTIEKDTLDESNRRLFYYRKRVQYQLKYSLLDNKDEWEFLYNTGKYNYTLTGGTRVNGEDVYIIDFTPKNSGKFIGRVYISINTSALIRADYEYAPEKTGRDLSLLGIGYSENNFSGSIYFEKKNDNYNLRYFSKRSGISVSIERNIALLKKRKRFLFDKKLNEVKVGLVIKLRNEESIELLFLNDDEISHDQFADFEQEEHLEIIYVDQFDENLWKGFSIIEPTEQMRDYKKQEVNY